VSRQYRPPRRRSLKVADKCQTCSEKKPPTELYSYVDGNNGSITQNAPILCRACYEVRYGRAS